MHFLLKIAPCEFPNIFLGFRETTTRANRDFMTSEYFSVTVGLATDNEISYFSYIYGLSRSSLMELKILR